MERIDSSTPDDELVHSLRAGHQDALGILYERYGQLVFSVALRILNRADEAEDLTQDIFLVFWKQENFQPERAALSTYLGVLTRSRALNKIRSRGSRRRSVERLQQSAYNEFSHPCPLEQATLQEQRQLVQQAVTQLPNNQKQVLTMNYLDGLSHGEIAQQLNMPLGTVKTNARQGLRRLRQTLGEAVG
ncbi:sigma-70 family RNA polymerase sigma factor [Nodosilinea sp. LEGE 07088]|uniref:sigma-70 family RNA polymerase sigma factor n=1 Tax=Nodosilinea sp. LEGE 07088 TaxID=2777968 RepID=UPI00187EAACA|nr:sigma-70 family RNA polymerase sigma factor [Nodosilinea sp. LEGE 07088]MBE9138587.1 sigma-70 family RNA polymerase sigma factor [Nodosilinea sp. LEGE 07088]